jgi:hypothetical protein
MDFISRLVKGGFQINQKPLTLMPDSIGINLPTRVLQGKYADSQ